MFVDTNGPRHGRSVPLAADNEPILVLSDVHLSAIVQPEREEAVCDLLLRHPGLDVVFLGDLFEFSSAKASDVGGELAQIVRANPRLQAALRQRTASGAHVYLAVGNHDAELMNLQTELRHSFGTRTVLVPWFLRFGGVHLEHGHVFDADNAPLHPLAPYCRAHESLGAALMRSVVVGLDVRGFAHAHHLTPLLAAFRAVRLLNFRLPVVVCRGVFILGALVVRAAWGRWGARGRARTAGERVVAVPAARGGLPLDSLQRLLREVAAPTNATALGMIWRLYLDIPIALGLAALCGLCSAGSHVAILGAGLSLTYAVASGFGLWSRITRVARYVPPLEALARGADAVIRLTGASRVVFGHTHVEYDDGVYFNLGSFGYGGPRGRPYAVITPNGTVTRGFVAIERAQEVALSTGSRNAGG
jgi:predicted phosphodiesterase